MFGWLKRKPLMPQFPVIEIKPYSAPCMKREPGKLIMRPDGCHNDYCPNLYGFDVEKCLLGSASMVSRAYTSDIFFVRESYDRFKMETAFIVHVLRPSGHKAEVLFAAEYKKWQEKIKAKGTNAIFIELPKMIL